MMAASQATMEVTTTTTATATTQWLTIIVATIYVLSGSTQPLLMTLVKSSGLGDPSCQVYMLFYYIGPAFVTFSLCCQPRPITKINTSTRSARSTSSIGGNPHEHGDDSSASAGSNTFSLVLKACSIAVIDIFAQSMNYTGRRILLFMFSKRMFYVFNSSLSSLFFSLKLFL